MHRRAYLAAVGTAASTGLAGCSSALSVLEDDPVPATTATSG